jgi:hypothetical protein
VTVALPPVGLIAGLGRPPFLAAEGAREAGRRVVAVGFRGLTSPRLRDAVDAFRWCGITRLGGIIRALRSWHVRQAVMIGAVRKSEIYSPFRVLRYIPDLRTVRLWYVKVRKDKRDNSLLVAIAEELQRDGIELVSCVAFCKEHLATEGQMTRTPPPRGAAADVDFGWRIAKASAELDIGQAVAVKERDIIAVEAMEGTDAMIRRAGELCRVGGWTLVKVARPNQDMRFDVPTVGPKTVRNLRDAGCACLVVEVGRTFIVDKPTTLDLADKLDLAIVGRCAEPPPK